MTGARTMPRKSLAHLFVCASMAAILAGCATSEAVNQTKTTTDRAEELAQVAARPMAPADVSPIKIKPDVYVGASAMRSDKGDPLPVRWERENVTVSKAGSVSFQDIASAITQQTGIPIAVGALSFSGSATTNVPAPTALPQPQQAPTLGVAAGPVPAGFDVNTALQAVNGQARPIPGPTGGTADVGIRGQMRISYTGKLSGLLDLVAANYNLGWEYRDGKIVFQRYISRTFDVPALPVVQRLQFQMKSTADNGGSGSSSTSGASATTSGGQTADTSSSYDLWKTLTDVMGTMVGSDGSFKLMAETGQISVIAPPSTMRRVQEYVKTLNQHLSKQVAISVKVYSVALSDGDDYNSDVNLLWKNAGKYGFSLVNSGMTGAVPTANSPAGIGWAVLNPNLPMQGNGLFKALSSRGDVSVVTSASVTTINGVPVPLQVANTRGYAARVSVTQSSSTTGGPTTSIEPGSVTTGFNLHLVPKVLKDGNLLLQYGMNISELIGSTNGFDVFSSGGSTIQLPNVNQRNFIQQAVLPNGSTLVLAGFEQVRSSTDKKGLFTPQAWPFGGSNASKMSREIIVIAITPTLLEVNSPSVSNGAPGPLEISAVPASVIPRP